VEIVGDGEDGAVTGLRVVRNRIEPDAKGRLRAVATDEEETLECGLVLRSIGYRGRPLPGVPFDESRGLIRNEGGRVTDEGGEPLPGEYVVGWIKRGPSGIIGTNKKDAADTVAKITDDVEAGRVNEPDQADGEATERWLSDRLGGLVTWTGWEKIDEHERKTGEPHNRPRVKLVTIEDLVEASRAGASRT
jgi:ferredoxin--NADP+ reductase